MPPGGGFPKEATEMFRLWYNQGGRVHTDDPYPGLNAPKNPILPPSPTPPTPTPTRIFVVVDNPVWDSGGTEDDIMQIFTNPCWIEGGQGLASYWRGEMLNFQYDAFTTPPTRFDLQNYDHMKDSAFSVYNHIASASMPIGSPFPTEPINAFGLWYKGGCPKTKDQIGKLPKPETPIQPPPVNKPFALRRDINTLTTEELTTYREKLLKLNSQGLDNSTWQIGGTLHGDWCLHYMQASFPWHRAHLLWLEWQIGVPIPYWNFFSSMATNLASPDSGIPQAFLDESFMDSNGNKQPNPLRYALARKGKSRASTSTTTIKEVQRASEFDDPTERANYIKQYVPMYLQQIYRATLTPTIGAQSEQGFTYAQPDLLPENPEEYYAGHTTELDGALEQAHDNLHGWSGADMANNSFAAFDPLFWSFHANFDRVFETWLRENGSKDENNWDYTAPLRPFALQKNASPKPDAPITVIEGEPDLSKYTTTKDMIQDCKSLGYSYAPPGNPDYKPSPQNVSSARTPMVLFPGTKCTDKTYYIHVALDKDDSDDLVVGQPGYIGSITRLGMGPDNGNDRCIQDGVIRKLEASKAAYEIGLEPDSPVQVKLLVREDQAGFPPRVVPKSEYKDWPGFTPVVIWQEPLDGIIGFEN